MVDTIKLLPTEGYLPHGSNQNHSDTSLQNLTCVVTEWCNTECWTVLNVVHGILIFVLCTKRSRPESAPNDNMDNKGIQKKIIFSDLYFNDLPGQTVLLLEVLSWREEAKEIALFVISGSMRISGSQTDQPWCHTSLFYWMLLCWKKSICHLLAVGSSRMKKFLILYRNCIFFLLLFLFISQVYSTFHIQASRDAPSWKRWRKPSEDVSFLGFHQMCSDLQLQWVNLLPGSQR